MFHVEQKEQLVETYDIEGTNFKEVHMREKGKTYLTWGPYLLQEWDCAPWDMTQTTKAWVEENKWMVIEKLIYAMMLAEKKLTEIQKAENQ